MSILFFPERASRRSAEGHRAKGRMAPRLKRYAHCVYAIIKSLWFRTWVKCPLWLALPDEAFVVCFSHSAAVTAANVIEFIFAVILWLIESTFVVIIT